MKSVLNKIVIAVGLLIVAQSAEAALGKNDRALVVVSELQTHGPQNLRGLYVALEELTQVHTTVMMAGDYRQVIYLKRDNATLAKFKSTLRALAARPEIKAIDVIMSLHGSDGRLYFREGRTNVADMLASVTRAANITEAALVNRMKSKLRMIYNLSCFGRSHNQSFREMGFDVTVGSNGINANSEVEYTVVLGAWKLGMNFVQAFDGTNNDAAIALADAPVRLVGIPADSKKYFRGSSSVNIGSEAQ